MFKRLVVYTPHITSRLQYVLQFVFDEVLKMPYVLTQDQSALLLGDCCLSYAHSKVPHAIQMHPAALLYETDIKVQELSPQGNAEGLVSIFPNQSVFTFDVFAAVFYVLTRYEEYLPHTKDQYGRYQHEQSIMYQQGVLHLSLVNRWVWHLYKVLKDHFPDLQACEPNWRILHTYDVDMAFSIQARTLPQVWRSIFGSICKIRLREALHKLQVYQGLRRDAFDCFEQIKAAHKDSEALFFFLMAERNTVFDRNNLPSDATMQQLIDDLSTHFTCGIHPSYEASLLPRLIDQEKALLQQHCQHHVADARFHYIRHVLPSSYRALLKYGIRHDYSCGYGSTNGFRAGTVSPHFWFDVQANETTSLRLQPFAWMDANCYYEHKYTTEEMQASYAQILEEIKNFGGAFTPIWHNFMIGDAHEFAAYKKFWSERVSSKN
jgi:hypothetical protein